MLDEQRKTHSVANPANPSAEVDLTTAMGLVPACLDSLGTAEYQTLADCAHELLGCITKAMGHDDSPSEAN